MKRVLIIGATGTVGGAVRQTLIRVTDAHLTLFARHRIVSDNSREDAVTGDVKDPVSLEGAVAGQDIVFAALSGDMADYARSIVAAMEKTGVARLIFISSMGIYDEIPDSLGGGNVSQNPVLRPYREAADVIKSSSLDYTVIRPGWFTSGPVDYEVTHKGEPFGGHDVSVGSIADAVRKIVEDPALYSHESIGINTPGR